MVPLLCGSFNQRLILNICAVNGQQVVDELRSDDIFRLITTIPWGHNQRIIFKCKDVREAVFYAQYTLENNWSRDVLEHQIESGLYERKGKAITNFKDKLPGNASDLATQTLKDPYSFDFLTMRDDYDEKEQVFPMWGVRCIYRLESVNFILICCFIT